MVLRPSLIHAHLHLPRDAKARLRARVRHEAGFEYPGGGRPVRQAAYQVRLLSYCTVAPKGMSTEIRHCPPDHGSAPKPALESGRVSASDSLANVRAIILSSSTALSWPRGSN